MLSSYFVFVEIVQAQMDVAYAKEKQNIINQFYGSTEPQEIGFKPTTDDKNKIGFGR